MARACVLGGAGFGHSWAVFLSVNIIMQPGGAAVCGPDRVGLWVCCTASSVGGWVSGSGPCRWCAGRSPVGAAVGV